MSPQHQYSYPDFELSNEVIKNFNKIIESALHGD